MQAVMIDDPPTFSSRVTVECLNGMFVGFSEGVVGGGVGGFSFVSEIRRDLWATRLHCFLFSLFSKRGRSQPGSHQDQSDHPRQHHFQCFVVRVPA